MTQNDLIARHMEAIADSGCCPTQLGRNGVTKFLKALLKSASKNAGRSRYARRYDTCLKLMSTYFYVIGGRLTYETLYANLDGAMPSTSYVQQMVRSVNEPAQEGQLRTREVATALSDRELPKFVWVCEDATRITGRVEYDRKTNRCVGFVPPLDENGMPDTTLFAALDADTIVNLFKERATAKYAYVVLVQPLQKGSAPISLMVFGTDNCFTGQQVENRWRFTVKKLKEAGITVLGFSSDGDSRLLSVMRYRCFKDAGQAPEQWRDWFAQDLNSPHLYIQDTIHILTKLRTRLLKTSILMPMGNYITSVTHLRAMLDSLDKVTDKLRRTDISNTDKMNYKAVENMTTEAVLVRLRQMDENRATEWYLTMMQDIITAFLTVNVEPLQRVYLMWRVVFFLRMWRLWLQEEEYDLQDHFVTNNIFLCIEVNAHNLVIGMRQLRDSHQQDLFLPFMWGSQPCEAYFRDARSLTSTRSTVVNFSILEFLRRQGRIELQSFVAHQLGDTFSFVRETHRQGAGVSFRERLLETTLPSDAEIFAKVKEAYTSAVEIAQYLGMELDDDLMGLDAPDCLYSDRINVTDETESDEEDELEGSTFPEELDPHDVATLRAAEREAPPHPGQSSDHTQHVLDPKSPYVLYRPPGGAPVMVWKGTLCWRLGSGIKKISADRIQRYKGGHGETADERQPTTAPDSVQYSDAVKVGEWCMFSVEASRRPLIGKVLGFRYMQGDCETKRQYHAESAPVKTDGLGCMCTCFKVDDISGTLTYLKYTVNPLNRYRCTLPPPRIKGNNQVYNEFVLNALNGLV